MVLKPVKSPICFLASVLNLTFFLFENLMLAILKSSEGIS